MVRPGRDKAQVEALFTRQGPEGEEEIVLRRELSAASGRSHFFLNGSLTSQDAVRALRPALLFHVSQHGQQRLLQPSYQAALIDAFLPDPSIVSRKDALVRELKDVGEQRRKLLERMDMLSEKRELLEMQQKEIEKVAPEEGEKNAWSRRAPSSRTWSICARSNEQGLELMLGGEGAGLAALLGELEKILHSLIQDDESFSPSLDALLNFEEEARELTRRFPQHALLRLRIRSRRAGSPSLRALAAQAPHAPQHSGNSAPSRRDHGKPFLSGRLRSGTCTAWKSRIANSPKNFMQRLRNATSCAGRPPRASAPRWRGNCPGSVFPNRCAWSRKARLTSCGRRWRTRSRSSAPPAWKTATVCSGPEPRTAPAAAGQNCLGRRTFPLPSGRGGRAIHKRRRHPYFRRSGRRRGRHDAEPRVRQAA